MKKRRFASPAPLYPKSMSFSGFVVQYIHLITSAPMVSAASSNHIAFPQLLCISRPSSARTVPWPRQTS